MKAAETESNAQTRLPQVARVIKAHLSDWIYILKRKYERPKKFLKFKSEKNLWTFRPFGPASDRREMSQSDY